MKTNKEKRKLKTEPTLKVELNDEQKHVSELLHGFDVVFVEGLWGSGKTLAAVASAVKEFRKKNFNEILITRPFIPDKGLGALPGEIQDKLIFENYPIIANFETVQGKELTDKMLKEGLIKIQYNGKVKGMTFCSSICIVDEGQDLTYLEFLELLTRLGKDSKIIFTLSKEQIHKSINKDSCYYTIKKLKNSNLVGWTELTSNHRNENITKIIDFLTE